MEGNALMKRMNPKAYRHNYPKDYSFMRHKQWKGDCNDSARKQGKQQCEDGIEEEIEDEICPTEGPLEGVKDLTAFRQDFRMPTIDDCGGDWRVFDRARTDWARDTYRQWEDYLRKEGVL